MTFELFHNSDPRIPPGSAAAEFYQLLAQLRSAAAQDSHPWSSSTTMVDYAGICFWAIRKQEYRFATEAIVAAERATGEPLSVLDVGCGVVPLGNWMSRRGHRVMAVDPLEENIDFLVRNDANGFYSSDVRYRVASAERLPFDQETFDVVTCVSVLEHTIPGNDRVALGEIGRVLRPQGRLVLTFDVAPQRPLMPGERPWPAERRRYGQVFSPASAAALMDWLDRFFEITGDHLPATLTALTWDQIHAFWRATQEHDRRETAERQYLATGAVLERRPAFTPLADAEIIDAMGDGQACLRERLEYFQHHAAERLKILGDLRERVATLEHEASMR